MFDVRAQRHERILRLPPGRGEWCRSLSANPESDGESIALQDRRAVAPGEFEREFGVWAQAGVLQVALDGVLSEVPAGQWRSCGAVVGGYFEHALTVLGCHFPEDVVEY